MQSPRSRNLERKPKACSWINEKPERAALLLETIRILETGYGGEFSGFVDFAPAEYRFNGKESGGYILLRARSNGSVRAQVQLEPDEWRELELKGSGDIDTIVSLISNNKLTDFDFEKELTQAAFDEAVKVSFHDSESERKRRLKNSNPEPRKIWQKVAVFIRNPDVVAEVLHRANGKCEAEDCGKTAPFIRRTNGTPYLEVHHRKKLSDGGDDTVENAVALCPNCHRKEHFG